MNKTKMNRSADSPHIGNVEDFSYRRPLFKLIAIGLFAFGLAFSLNVSAADPNCYQCARYCESLFYWCNGDFDTCHAIYLDCYSGCGCDI